MKKILNNLLKKKKTIDILIYKNEYTVIEIDGNNVKEIKTISEDKFNYSEYSKEKINLIFIPKNKLIEEIEISNDIEEKIVIEQTIKNKLNLKVKKEYNFKYFLETKNEHNSIYEVSYYYKEEIEEIFKKFEAIKYNIISITTLDEYLFENLTETEKENNIVSYNKSSYTLNFYVKEGEIKYQIENNYSNNNSDVISEIKNILNYVEKKFNEIDKILLIGDKIKDEEFQEELELYVDKNKILFFTFKGINFPYSDKKVKENLLPEKIKKHIIVNNITIVMNYSFIIIILSIIYNSVFNYIELRNNKESMLLYKSQYEKSLNKVKKVDEDIQILKSLSEIKKNLIVEQKLKEEINKLSLFMSMMKLKSLDIKDKQIKIELSKQLKTLNEVIYLKNKIENFQTNHKEFKIKTEIDYKKFIIELKIEYKIEEVKKKKHNRKRHGKK